MGGWRKQLGGRDRGDIERPSIGTRKAPGNKFFPTPVHREGKPQRLTARVKIASAPVFPTASFYDYVPRAAGRNFRFVCVSVYVCPWCQSDVPNLGAKSVLVAPSNAATQISPPAEEASM